MARAWYQKEYSPVAPASLCHLSLLLRYTKHSGAAASLTKPRYMRKVGDLMANIFHFGSVLPTKLAMIVLKNKTCIAMPL